MDSAEGQGVSCHENGEIVGQGGDDGGRAWRLERAEDDGRERDGDDGRQGMEAGHGDRGGTGMTGDRAWRPGTETEDGDRGRRQGMETGNGDWQWRLERAEDDGGRAW